MCGLAAYVPKGKNSKMNPLRFKSLLIYNEERGKRSTGIWSEYEGVLKDITSAKDFTKEIDWLDINRQSIFLGHTRQPTSGYPVTLEGAQPIEVGNIVMIHNGSIYNKHELARKYNVKFEQNNTDSVILAKILENKDFNVFEDYIGAATCMWVYLDEPNVFYFYKGASKKTNSDLKLTVERPLYSMMTKEGIYFASLSEYLENVAVSEEELESIGSVPENIVFSVDTNDISMIDPIQEIKRKETQSRPTSIVGHSNKKSKKGKKVSGIGFQNTHKKLRDFLNNQGTLADLTNSEDDYAGCDADCGSEDTIPYSKDNSIFNVKSKEDLDEYNILNRLDVMTKLNKIEGHPFTSFYNDLTDKLVHNEEVNLEFNMNTDEYEEDGGQYRVYYNKGRYWYNDIVANGNLKLLLDGTPDPEGKLYTFVEGCLLDDDCNIPYHRLRNELYELGTGFGEEKFAEEMSEYSSQPIPYYADDYCGLVYSKGMEPNFDGEYMPLFNSRGKYIFNWGFLEKIESIKQLSMFNDVSKEEDDDTTNKNTFGIEPGDVITVNTNVKVVVLSLSAFHFTSISVDNQTKGLYRYSDINEITLKGAAREAVNALNQEDENLAAHEEKMADEEMPFGEMENAQEAYEVREISIEFMDACNDCVKQLQNFPDSDSATNLIQDINRFVENNLVL